MYRSFQRIVVFEKRFQESFLMNSTLINTNKEQYVLAVNIKLISKGIRLTLSAFEHKSEQNQL